MREIKFRAYVPPNTVQVHEYKNGVSREYTKKDPGKMLQWDEFNLAAWLRNGSAERVMQFTGLHDCTKWEQMTEEEKDLWLDEGKTKEEWKGREIYEGDILKDSWSEDNIGVVEFKDGQIHYNLSYIENEADQAQASKVIGNIYENPELLKQ